ncbi:MAG: NADPH:quinone reductase [Halobacteriaceae archaeon]
MRAVRYHEHGGPSVLTVDEVERPDPGHGEVRIDVRAVGVNPVDTYLREGSYEPPVRPMIPGSDVAGLVSAVGPGVDRLAAGDRVFATGLGRDRQGTYAESVLAPASSVAALPGGITFREGAAVALVGLTAWRALIDHARLEPAERCLVHGGNGGVGHVAVQLAAAAGADVTATARPPYHGALSDLGASDVLDYRQAQDALADGIRAAGRPDVVLNHRLDEYLSLDAAVAAPDATVVGIGNQAAAATLADIPGARARELAVQFMVMFNAPDVAGVLARLADLMRDGDLAPEVARTYDLAEAATAQRAVLEESFLGKVVLTVGGAD